MPVSLEATIVRLKREDAGWGRAEDSREAAAADSGDAAASDQHRARGVP